MRLHYLYRVDSMMTTLSGFVKLSLLVMCCTLPPSSFPGNCSDPGTPRNGFIGPYQNTTEGAEISFRCNSQYVPTTARIAICGADGRWNPDPATHMCKCEYPPMA